MGTEGSYTVVKIDTGDFGNCNRSVNPLSSRWNFNQGSD